MSIFDNKNWIPRKKSKIEDVVVVSYFPINVYEDNILSAQEGHNIVAQKKIGPHHFRQVSTAQFIDGVPSRLCDSLFIASYILIKEPGDSSYKMFKNRRFFAKGVQFYSLRDFEDMIGMHD